MPAPKASDASKLTFPLQLVIAIVVGVSAQWATTYSLRSDVRNINTLIEQQGKSTELQRQLDRERVERLAEKQQAQSDILKASVDEIRKNYQLMQIEFQNFKEQMLALQGRR